MSLQELLERAFWAGVGWANARPAEAPPRLRLSINQRKYFEAWQAEMCRELGVDPLRLSMQFERAKEL